MELKARYLDTDGRKVGSLVSEGLTQTDPPAPPVPEPETYAMFLAGLGILGAIGRRRKAMQ